jgi:cyclic-di-AMP phosphodiesterase PgpH
MSSGNSRRGRWAWPTPRKPMRVAWDWLQRGELWVRIEICAAVAVALWLVTSSWAPQFPYRTRMAPTRDLYSRAKFEYPDVEATKRAKEKALREVLCYYKNDTKRFDELRQALINRIYFVSEKSYEELDRDAWNEFYTQEQLGRLDSGQLAMDHKAFRESVADAQQVEALKQSVQLAMLEYRETGLIDSLKHKLNEGSQQFINVFTDDPAVARRVEVDRILIPGLGDQFDQKIKEAIRKESDVIPKTDVIAPRVAAWLKKRLPVSLSWDKDQTRIASIKAVESVKPIEKQYQRGDPLEKQNPSDTDLSALRDGPGVIQAGKPLDAKDIELLRAEHSAYVQSMSWWQTIIYSASIFGMYSAVFCLLAGYLVYREPRLIVDLRQFSTLLGLFALTVCLAWWVSLIDQWRAELIPIVMCAMIVSIAYHREIALLISATVALVFTMSHGYGLNEFVILMGTSSAASLLCGRIRSRTRLVYVGIIAASVAFPTTIGVSTLVGQPFGTELILDAIWFAGCAVLAGLLMTALLPFLEQWFEIQTDINLLELCDANHPILKQLVQRAPGTYNHSINVASIAESAADRIGANGLLCRVGAYFHDIGKMRKPEYFIENQSGMENKHDGLVPTMSTLVIIAHVKDGAEMARDHHLPQRIIDIIEQHHGTTLVEYFYNRATRQSEHLEDAAEIEEADFRYPGPKPQSPEAAVMMLADAVESATRTLREPTPSRIEHLVEGILKKRLHEGQFDECSLTLVQLHTIQDSLIKSLNAMYHARVKYPGQQTA